MECTHIILEISRSAQLQSLEDKDRKEKLRLLEQKSRKGGCRWIYWIKMLKLEHQNNKCFYGKSENPVGNVFILVLLVFLLSPEYKQIVHITCLN